ncbi:hypothetical protein [Methylobacterium radiodurans]|uniref:Uncharacterized protein n=1 Tax=Methylobacterium radiodurans TaxID=2202828 RepID=A0A2U8VWS9_9HYPH|nr:hypothetical protein [Methylobacterium radiodurans]AWN37672.1 hypothetical protein DK427_19680 [Methylobacterium radiodurans]
MNRRRLASEPPAPDRIEFRLPREEDEKVSLAATVIARVAAAGADPDVDAETLALHADEKSLSAMLALAEPVTDIRGYLVRTG